MKYILPAQKRIDKKTKINKIKAYSLLTALLLIQGCATAIQNNIRNEVLSNPDLKPEIRDAIQRQAVHVGMTKQQVLASWGEPCWWCYGTRKTSNGDSWEYNVFGSSYMGAGSGTYLYFDNNGILKFWSK